MKKYRDNTLTERNLHVALNDEALCHVKYMIWGEEAEREGYPEIAHFYKTAASNELSHARIWMDELGMMGATNENLQSSVICEENGNRNYISFASDAEDEGYDNVKNKFLAAAESEKNHSAEFSRLHNRYVSDDAFVSDCKNTKWRCFNCGYVSEGENAPERCPLCGRPETWFVRIE